MTLNPTPLYPSVGCYVLKLHRDALAGPHGALFGRLEHIVSGDSTDFASGVGLLAWLLEHAAAVRPETSSTGTPT